MNGQTAKIENSKTDSQTTKIELELNEQELKIIDDSNIRDDGNKVRSRPDIIKDLIKGKITFGEVMCMFIDEIAKRDNKIKKYRNELNKMKKENSKLKKELNYRNVTNNKKPIEMTVSTK